MLYFSHPACLGHDPTELMPGHPEAPGRLRAIEARLAAEDWLGWERREPAAAAERDLEAVHGAGHVERIRRLATAGGSAIDPDTYVVEGSFEAALRAAGAATAMARALLSGEARTGFCGIRPPGHHAEPDRAMGFCLFNNVAIAAELAIRELGAQRVFVVDWDVHHGNGTERAFRGRDDVLYASIHEAGIFPGTGAATDRGSGRGEGFTINAPMPAGSGEDEWVAALEGMILPAAARFGPDLVLVSAGFDAHREDPLADCLLETSSFGRMAAAVRELADDAGAPLGAVLEGGYDTRALADSVRETLLALGGR